MRVAITQRVIEHGAYPERRDALAHDWSRWFRRLLPGAALIPVPNDPDALGTLFSSVPFDAAVLSGGNDWGEAPERDETERRLVEACRQTRVPVLGVCRGLQVMNVLLGGTISTAVSGRTGTSHAGTVHEVTIAGAAFTRLSPDAALTVNSFHGHGVTPADLAAEARVFATGGGCVEGLYHSSEPLLAIQWHPERPNPGAVFDTTLLRCFFDRGAFWDEDDEGRER
jgi:N5-(cytidine 5'-diphosphoramidyl)-L-glutamine hydrolase